MKIVAAVLLVALLLVPGVALASSQDAALALGAFAVFNQMISGTGIFGGVAHAGVAPVVVAPQPVYAPAPPVVIAPRPVHLVPAPVVVAPRPVYVAPAPVFVAPRPVYVHGHPRGYGHWKHHGYWKHHGHGRHDGRWHRH
jgi:hypothetical protein